MAPDRNQPVTAVAQLDASAVAALLNLLGGDAAALVEVLDAFVDEAPSQLVCIEEGIADGDLAAVHRAAHTLKSNALTFGASGFADASRRLEEAARAGDAAAARELAGAVSSAWAESRPALGQLRGRYAA